MAQACSVIVAGRVQGVAFRAHARRRAAELGLAGWVRNRRDGTVEVWAEGDGAALQALLDWLRRGPPLAEVRECRVRWESPRGMAGFEVQETV
ncbi:MAG: acylphosphatase [Pseudomonadota bacterium]|uniref:acylphosphatase n=1 Tax=Thermithiobacillus tepidarius TaxID=929 RepID=UPI0003F836CF|nr:acylphosphatase [Thermithiobacillus tepidarius]